MELRLDPDHLAPWAQVIRHLAAEYGFPATDFNELRCMFRMYTGQGSTFRIEKEKWKFVVDVIRRDDVILSIVAISLMAKTTEDKRYEGAVIARACQIHPNDGKEDCVGSPLLKWYMVTRGGMKFQHCCDNECSGPDKMLGAPKFNWETCRLKVIQKAYEQEVLCLYQTAENRAKDVKSKDRAISRKANAVQHLHYDAQQAREIAQRAREDAQEANEKTRLAQEEARQAKDDFNELHRQFCKLRQQKDNIAGNLSEKQKSLSEILDKHEKHNSERETLQMSISALTKENNVKDAIIQNLRTELETIRQQGSKAHDAVTDSVKLLKKLDRLEKKKNDYSQRLCESAGDIRELEAMKADLESQIEAKSKKHSQEKMVLQYEAQDLRQQNEDLNNGYKELLEQKAGLHIKITNSDEREKRMQDRLSQLQAEMSLKNDYGRRVEAQLESSHKELQDIRRKHVDELDLLRREIQTKSQLIQQLQQNWQFHGSSSEGPMLSETTEPLGRPTGSTGDLVAQQTALHEAQERATDLENKIKGLKKAMKDKTSELAAREKSCADKLSAVADREKKCAERERYTVTLEKELEEVRGTLEGVIGRVSTHQGRKRRRTEGPEDQSEGSSGF